MFQRQQKSLPDNPPKQLSLFNSDFVTVEYCAGHNNWYEHAHGSRYIRNFLFHVEVLHRFVTALMKSEKPITLHEIGELLPSVLAIRYSSENGTATKCIKTVRQLLKVLDHFGVEYLSDVTSDVLDEFYWMPSKRRSFQEPSSATAANRQWAVRVMFSVLTEMGLWVGTDISGVTIVREHGRTSRPATLNELKQLQVMSRNVLVPNGDELLVALALCGGSASEIASVCTQDIDLGSQTVCFTGTNQRHNHIDDWSIDVISQAIVKIPESTPMVVRPGLGVQRATHSVTVRLNRLVAQTISCRHGELTGVSIRLGAANTILELDGLEAAARFLGNQSLDATAKALRYEWWVSR